MLSAHYFEENPFDREGLARRLEERGLRMERTFRNEARFDGHLRIYPELRCNLRCPYCVNEEVPGRVKGGSNVPAKDWIAAVNREGRHVVLTGGEPFLYPDLVGLINGIDPALKVRVYSNFCLDLGERLTGLRRPVHFFLSWHPAGRAFRERFLHNIGVVRNAPGLSCEVHSIDAPESEDGLDADLRHFRERGLEVRLDPDQRGFAGSGGGPGRSALCRKRIYLIGPDGTRYQCVSRLMRRDAPMENMLAGPLREEAACSFCPDFGHCAPCDQLGDTVMHEVEREAAK